MLAIFGARYLNDRAPLVFEDGRQKRDFVSVHDVARACTLALDAEAAVGCVLNVGSGRATSILELASRFAEVLGKEHLAAEVTGKYRVGDIRHCFADISRARARLGYEPQVSLEQGLATLAEWLSGQIALDRVGEARQQLLRRGLSA